MLIKHSDIPPQSFHDMNRTLMLDIIISQGSFISHLFTCENEPLIVNWGSVCVKYFPFHILYCISWLDL